MSSQGYLVHQDGIQSGPFDIQELRMMWDKGILKVSAVCWTQGMPQWELVHIVLGISLQTAPETTNQPPAGGQNIVDRQTDSRAPIFAATGSKSRPMPGLFIGIAIVMVICAAAALMVFRWKATQRTPSEESQTVTPSIVAPTPKDLLVSGTWKQIDPGTDGDRPCFTFYKAGTFSLEVLSRVGIPGRVVGHYTYLDERTLRMDLPGTASESWTISSISSTELVFSFNGSSSPTKFQRVDKCYG